MKLMNEMDEMIKNSPEKIWEDGRFNKFLLKRQSTIVDVEEWRKVLREASERGCHYFDSLDEKVKWDRECSGVLNMDKTVPNVG